MPLIRHTVRATAGGLGDLAPRHWEEVGADRPDESCSKGAEISSFVDGNRVRRYRMVDTEFYVASQSTFGESTGFAVTRWENRFRPFMRERSLNEQRQHL